MDKAHTRAVYVQEAAKILAKGYLRLHMLKHVKALRDPADSQDLATCLEDGAKLRDECVNREDEAEMEKSA